MSIDMEIVNFRNHLVNEINKSGLPLEIKRLCLFELHENLRVTVDKTIREETEKNKEEAKLHAQEAASRAKESEDAAKASEENAVNTEQGA